MPSVAVNRPTTLAHEGVTASMQLTAVPADPELALATLGADPNLTIADGASVIYTAPLAVLRAGMTVDLGVTSTGLAVTEVPPGVALLVNF